MKNFPLADSFSETFGIISYCNSGWRKGVLNQFLKFDVLLPNTNRLNELFKQKQNENESAV